MSTYSVCLRCSQQLFQCNRQIRTSSFVSLGKLVANNAGGEKVVRGTTVAERENAKAQRPRKKKRLSFAKQWQEKRKASGVDEVLETLFSSNRVHNHVLQRSRYSRTPKEQSIEPATHEKSLYHQIQVLHGQLQQGKSSLEDIWTSCQELLSQKNWIPLKAILPDDEKSVSTYAVFRDILLAICSKQRIVMKDAIVTPAEVIRLYQKHGVMKYWWDDVLWCQLAEATRLQYHREGDVSAGNKVEKLEETTVKDNRLEGIQTILKEILDVWNLFMQRYGAVPASLSIQNDVPEPIDTVTKPATSLPTNIASRFLRLMPKHPKGTHVRRIPTAAILTLDAMEAAGLDSAPVLSQFFKRLKEGCTMDRKAATRCLADAAVPSDIIDKTLANWGPSPTEASERLFIEREKKKLPQIDELDWSDSSLWLRFVDLESIQKRSDAEEAFRFWRTFRSHLEVQGAEDHALLDRIFARFLRLFWTLRRGDQALEVWNFMIKMGRRPNPIHWTAMLMGCSPSRDTQSMQEIWSNMLRSGVKPDIETWTTYIHGLIRGYKVQEGFEALEILGRSWKPAPSSAGQMSHTADSNSNILEHSLEPINGALSALIAIQRYELTHRVVRWAEQQGMHLSTYTFNILLRPLVRAGTQRQIQSHLEEMKAHDCAPDVVTFTIIINGLISNEDSHFHRLSPEEQESTVTSLLADMESQKITPDPKTYSTLLDGLLGKTNPKHQRSVNIPAARTVLAHMAERSVAPSPHIYTILMAHYFSFQPPDYPAIDSLLENIFQSGKNAELDHIFYDRIIEGYAFNREIEKALKFLRKVAEEGMTPGYVALYKILDAMAEMGEWELCRELVRDVEDPEEGLLRHGVGTWRGKSSFWELVALLRQRGVLDEPYGERGMEIS